MPLGPPPTIATFLEICPFRVDCDFAARASLLKMPDHLCDLVQPVTTVDHRCHCDDQIQQARCSCDLVIHAHLLPWRATVAERLWAANSHAMNDRLKRSKHAMSGPAAWQAGWAWCFPNLPIGGFSVDAECSARLPAEDDGSAFTAGYWYDLDDHWHCAVEFLQVRYSH